ncbi:hypothetical protein ACGF3G_24275 [Streptomyces sp. NPDC048179]|uniref:hypothetical protein n=1 Tax=Streptomyces sp. NPDC048179 TaxID=3365506 RepID=UPI00372155B2
MAGLEDRARDLLRAAALIGRDVDLRLLSRATGVDVADCLQRLELLRTLGLLEPGPRDPSSLRFAHDLVRESVSETATPQQVTGLHLRVADALEHIHADDEDVTERLAYHLWAAGPLADPARTAEALIRAGRRAAAKLAFESAGRQLRSAVQVARAAGLMELEFSALTLLVSVEPGQQLTGTIMGAFLSYVLVPQDHDRTRLLLKVVMQTGRWTAIGLSVGDLIMARRQLLNLKRLAERQGR